MNIFNLNNGFQNNRFNWINHVERLTPERIEKQLMNCTLRNKIHRRINPPYKGPEEIESQKFHVDDDDDDDDDDGDYNIYIL
jgi:hypothetical protein